MAGPQLNATTATTMMMQNLPSRCDRVEVLGAIDKLGFEGLYDFFYLPQRSRVGRSQNFGYAFINFTDPAVGSRFHELANDGSLRIRNKSVRAVIADIQGLHNLKKHFRGKLVMIHSNAPVFAEDTLVAQGEQPMLADSSLGQYGVEPQRSKEVSKHRKLLADMLAEYLATAST
eukprot:TRINITY_DN4882_c0_g1_i1.p1 TRINITY_DN4882_c0_g1~~TRINITY_DN4882_c0_g1_i1.p1  ORF type:complete len:194 (+),score=45.23 TRINITY_DN4882_c0_g1_i1:63-584(+)